MAGQPAGSAAWGAAVAALATCAPAFAFAQAPAAASPIAVDWRGPGNCPDGDRVLAGVHRLLGGVPPRRGRELRVRGRVEAGGFGFALDLRTEDEKGQRGQRTLTASTCEALADAAALVVALGWDPEAVAAARSRPDPAPPAPTGPPPSPPPPPTPPPTSAPSGPPERPVEAPRSPPLPRVAPRAGEDDPWLAFGAGLALDLGGLPGLSAGFGGWAGLLFGPYRLELAGTGFPTSEARLDGDAERGGRFVQALGSLHLCRAVVPWTTPREGNELAACLGMEGGVTFASGFGVDKPEDASVGWAAPRAGVQGRLEISSGLGARLDLGIAVPIVRGPFVLEELGEIHRPSPVTGRFSAGLDLRF